MANPTVSLVAYMPPKGNNPGSLVVDLAWTTYATNADVLDLSGIRATGFTPDMVKHAGGYIPSTGHNITLNIAASPTPSNLGVLRAWSGTTEVVAGAFANTARMHLVLQRGRTV